MQPTIQPATAINNLQEALQHNDWDSTDISRAKATARDNLDYYLEVSRSALKSNAIGIHVDRKNVNDARKGLFRALETAASIDHTLATHVKMVIDLLTPARGR
ncbi:MAG: hypothetical protein ACOYNL_07135 [Rickettsiales bacterium]